MRKLLGCVREYKKPTIITLVLIVFEAIVETCIPFITANLVNDIKAGAMVRQILITGVILFGLACQKPALGYFQKDRHLRL